MEPEKIQRIVEGAILAAGRPLSVNDLLLLFGLEDAQPTREDIKAALDDVETDCRGRGYELKQIASGYRFQVREELAPWIGRLWDEKPQKYSRALLETLAIIAYRQPITRGEIEEIRGVAVSSNIIRTLTEREWIRIVGYREVPGKPALYATTKQFLDYFNLQKLDELPPLSEIRDLAEINPELALDLGIELNEDTSETAGDSAPLETGKELADQSTEVDPAEGDELLQGGSSS